MSVVLIAIEAALRGILASAPGLLALWLIAQIPLIMTAPCAHI